MGNLWHFFGLPDPEGGPQPPPRQKPVAEQQPSLEQREQIPEPVLEVTQETSHDMYIFH